MHGPLRKVLFYCSVRAVVEMSLVAGCACIEPARLMVDQVFVAGHTKCINSARDRLEISLASMTSSVTIVKYVGYFSFSSIRISRAGASLRKEA